MQTDITDHLYRQISTDPVCMWVKPKLMEDRIDAGFYHPHYLQHMATVRGFGRVYTVAEASSKIKCGPFGSAVKADEYTESGIPFLRGFNFQDGLLDDSQMAFIPSEVHQRIIATECHPGDIIFSQRGNVGTVGLVSEQWKRYNISANLIYVRFRSSIDSAFMAMYFQTRYGQSNIARRNIATTLPKITTDDVKSFIVPLPPRPVQTYIGDKVRLAERCRSRARELTAHIKKRLDRILGQPLPEVDFSQPIFVLPDEVSTERLDSKFYQLRYIQADHLIRNFTRGHTLLKELVAEVSNGIEYREFVAEGKPYLTVGNIQAGRLDLENAPRIPWAASISSRGKIKTNDVLVVRTGSIGQAAFVRNSDVNAVISSHFVRLRLHQPQKAPWIAFFLESWIGKLLQERIAYGAVQPQIGQDLLLEFPIPNLDNEELEFFASTLQDQYTLLDRAATLVAEAKADVEALIEGRLDVAGIVAGQVVAPTWEDAG